MKRLLTAFVVWGFASGAYASDIVLAWEAPTEREDGSEIETIDRYNLYTTIDNVFQGVIEVTADSTSFSIPDVAIGNYTFQISTVESGLESELSSPASVNVSEALRSKPVKIELTVRVID